MGLGSCRAKRFLGNDMSEPLASPVGFSDSVLRRYERCGNSLVVVVGAWNEVEIVLTFRDVLGVREILAGGFSEVVRGAESSASFLLDVLGRNFGTVPLVHSYGVYSFLDHDGEPSLEVVAVDCCVVVGGR